ncbi:carotenoid oxygenase [Mycena crocata]|nr:carotenoid oxygenase [Mycena crocata]
MLNQKSIDLDKEIPDSWYTFDGRYEADTFFAFHASNYFDDDGFVVIDLVCYKDNSILDKLTIDHLRAYAQDPSATPVIFDAVPHRFRNSANIESSTINPRFAWKPYRYAYGVHSHSEKFFNAVIKLDVPSGEFLLWEQSGGVPGEPIFVCDPNSSDEDAGVLLTVVLDGIKGVRVLVVLNAKTMRKSGGRRWQFPSSLRSM